jgi:hypothetical protein
MRSKKGTLLPKKGTLVPRTRKGGNSALNYASGISAALRRDLGRTRGAAKTVMQWTGASERAVKNWFAGTKAPSGEHLIMLARHSDAVLSSILRMCRGEDTLSQNKLIEARSKLEEAMRSLDGMSPLD